MTKFGLLLLRRNQHCQAHAVQVTINGANAHARLQPIQKLPGKSNYLIGRDRSKWLTGVPSYARVRYVGIYPDVDLVYYGHHHQLEFDFVIAPGGDPNKINLSFAGQEQISIAPDGKLRLGLRTDALSLHRPLIYQIDRGKKHFINGGFRLLANERVGIRIGVYNHQEPLIVDPVLAYSTYLSGSLSTGIYGIAVDANGDAYVAGSTSSTNFPVVNQYQGTSPGGYLGFVSEFNPTGTALLYSTYLGGTDSTSETYGQAVAVDANGNAYVVGETDSTDFPIVNGFQSTNNNPKYGNAFVARINTTLTGSASLVYSTYLGGGGNSTNPVNGGDAALGIAVDFSGHAYTTGVTGSDSSVVPFPTTPTAFQLQLNSPNGNAFLSVLDTTQSGTASLLYSTYLGGDGISTLEGDVSYGITIDPSGDAYIVGETTSNASGPFPTTADAFQGSLNSPSGNAFLAEIAPYESGSASLVYSTYFGGSIPDSDGDADADDGDLATAVALDTTGMVYITGYAESADFPVTSGAFQTMNSSGGKAFVAKFDLTNSGNASLVYSTFLGGNSNSEDGGNGIAVDASGAAFVVGVAQSTDFPVTSDALQSTLKDTSGSAFFTRMNPTGTGLQYSTYLGGSGGTGGGDCAFAIALDASGNAYIGGYTFSSDFPVTTGAFQTTNSGAEQAGFVSKFSGLGGGNNIVQQSVASAESSTGLNVTLPALPQAGDALVLSVVDGGSYATSVTGGGVTWALAAKSCEHECVEIWYGLDSNASSNTIQITFPTTANISANLVEVANVVGLDATGSGTYGTSADVSTSTVTTANSNDFLVAAAGLNVATVTGGPSGSWYGLASTEPAAGHPIIEPAYSVVASTGAYSTSWTLSSGTGWDTVIVALKMGSGNSIVQQSVASAESSTGLNVTLPALPQAGDALVLSVVDGGSYATSVTGGGVTWALAAKSCEHECVEIWYGLDSNASSNTVQITFPTTANISANLIEVANVVGLDATGSGTYGTSADVSTSTVTTANSNDFLVAAAGLNVATITGGPSGSWYGLASTEPAAGHPIIEPAYSVVASTGAYSTSWTLSSGTGWDTVIVALKMGSSGGGGTGPQLSSLSPTFGPVGTSVTIGGSNFGSSQGSSTVTFNGVNASPTSWSAASIVAAVPSGATTGNVIVTVGGTASNGVNFTVGSSAPSISSLSPSSGSAGASVTITGINFGSTQGSSTVTFGSVSATATTWNGTTIIASIPSTTPIGSAPVVVMVADVASNNYGFTVTGPSGPTIYYYLQDSLGTTRVMTDSAGNVCYDADFYPFGGERPYIDSCPQNYLFTGKERDPESNLDNFGARYDSSQLGRFMSPDPLGGHLFDPQTLNKYVYARDNPLRYTDPTGLDLKEQCSQESATCHKQHWWSRHRYVGTFDQHHHFDITHFQTDQNGNLAGHTVNFDSTGPHIDNNRAEFIAGTPATRVNGTGAFDGMHAVFNSNCGGTCAAGGLLFGTQAQFQTLLNSGNLVGPNPGLDAIDFFHPGTIQFRGGNTNGPDAHLSFEDSNNPYQQDPFHFDNRYPYGSAGGFLEHTGGVIQTFWNSLTGQHGPPLPQDIPNVSVPQ